MADQFFRFAGADRFTDGFVQVLLAQQQGQFFTLEVNFGERGRRFSGKTPFAYGLDMADSVDGMVNVLAF
jgi:hypothetical protein